MGATIDDLEIEFPVKLHLSMSSVVNISTPRLLAYVHAGVLTKIVSLSLI